MARLLIVAGELSSDTYGAELAEELLSKNKHLDIVGLGGMRLKKVSTLFLQNIAEAHVIGFWEQLSRLRYYKQVFKRLKKFLKETPIDLAVIIDFQIQKFGVI